MANLYELMGEYEVLQKMVDDEGVAADAVAAYLDRLDESKGSLRDKVDNICRVLKNLDGDIDAIKKEEKRLKARRQARENNVEKLREWVFSSMSILEVQEIKTDVFTVSVVNGREKVVIVDESKIPEDFWKVKRDPDTKKLMDAYKEDGEIVAGVDIIRPKQLRIR